MRDIYYIYKHLIAIYDESSKNVYKALRRKKLLLATTLFKSRRAMFQ